MSLQVRCPNGHRLKVKNHWAGKTGRCPKCRAIMQVPELELESVPASISDDYVLEIIGDFVPSPRKPASIPIPTSNAVPDDDADSSNVLDDFEAAMNEAASGLSLIRSGVVKHQKKCECCGKHSNLWFATCDHCGEFFED